MGTFDAKTSQELPQGVFPISDRTRYRDHKLRSTIDKVLHYYHRHYKTRGVLLFQENWNPNDPDIIKEATKRVRERMPPAVANSLFNWSLVEEGIFGGALPLMNRYVTPEGRKEVEAHFREMGYAHKGQDDTWTGKEEHDSKIKRWQVKKAQTSDIGDKSIEEMAPLRQIQTITISCKKRLRQTKKKKP